jgi:Tfp pilus assembly protein PilX
MKGWRWADQGFATIAVLIVSGLVGLVAIGLALMVSIEHLTARNHRESVALVHAAEGGVELAARAMARAADWDAVLSGLVQAPGVDGPPSGLRDLGGGARVDLDARTHMLNCGRPVPCTQADLTAITSDRPWGENNPHWRLFLYGRLADLGPFRSPAPTYVLVWVADDAREEDGDASRDGASARGGQGLVRVRGEAVGAGGGRRAIEAELSRVCRTTVSAPTCLPGIRVQSWRDVRHAVP